MKSFYFFKSSLLLVALLVVCIALATFMQKYDSFDVSLRFIYNTVWFEILWWILGIFMSVNFLYQLIYGKAKIGSFTLHLGIILIILAAILSKHFAYEGQLYLSVNEDSNTIYSKNYSMMIHAQKGNEKVSHVVKGDNSFEHRFDIFGQELFVRNNHYYQHVKALIQKNQEQGVGVIDVDVIEQGKRENYVFEHQGQVNLQRLQILFNQEPMDIQKPYFKIVANEHQMIHFISNRDVESNFEEQYAKNSVHKFHPGILYKVANVGILADDIVTLAKVNYEYDNEKKGRSALFTSLDLNGHNKEVTLLESAEHYASYKQTVFFNDIRLDMEWGKTPTKLPFSILLNDFMVQHYFGSSMVSSYESDIHLQDEAKNTFLTQKVSINHPLRYKGYSIFQTSSFIYGKTVLHINYNPFVSVIYLGYILVCMGFFLLLFSQNSYFIKLKNSLQT